ncbi:MAG: SGNH/GDSL hydrolase family protein, partial [Clostridiales bacterium]|nr:SGNH/GDSL hydrolase family protein [Clostridiales bacterium]
KKFLFKISIFLIIILSIILSLNARWINTEMYMLQDEKYLTAPIPKNIDILNVGSSHGMTNFEYSFLDDKYSGTNLGRAMQMFYYDLEMLKKNRNKINKEAVVFIPISYFSYFQYFDETHFSEKEYIYHYFLNFWQVKNKSLLKALEHKWLPILFIREDQIKYLFHDEEGAIKNYDKVFAQSKLLDESGEIDMERLLKARDRTVKVHTEGFERGTSQVAIDKLKEMLEYCKKNNYQCILITTPFTSQYNEAFADSFYADFYETTTQIANEYDVPYWDYSHETLFSDDPYLFYDDDHLNHKGRKAFSEMIVDRAIDEGYLTDDEN